MLRIDRNSPIPVYYQIELDLKKRIERHEWDAYHKLPSEAELAQQYDVSRVTIRQTLAELEKDGVISRYQGKGAFINASPVPFVHEFSYALVLGERISQQGFSMTAKVLNQVLVDEPPFPDIAEGLQLQTGDKVVYIKRLFLLDERPIAIGRSWLNAATVPGFEAKPMVDNSLSKSMAHYYRHKPITVDDYLEVVRATPSDRNLLKSAPDMPLLLVKGISFLAGGHPLEYSETVWSGDNVRFHFSLKLSKDGLIVNL